MACAMRALSSAWSSSFHLPTSWYRSARISSSGCVQLGEDRAEPRRATAAPGCDQPLDAADGEQRVLVDRVLVEEVAHHAARDGAELREQPLEQPAVVELGKPRVESRARAQQAQQPLALGGPRDEVRRGERAAVTLEQRERRRDGARHRDRARPRSHRARRPGSRRPAPRRRSAPPAPSSTRFAPRSTRVAAASLAMDRAVRAFEAASDRARMAEVLAHQRFDPLLRAGAEATQPVGRHLLQVVAQHVRVAAGLEMEDRPHAQQEVLGLLQASVVDRDRRRPARRRASAGASPPPRRAVRPARPSSRARADRGCR